MMNLRKELKQRRLYFDGGTGTVLQAMGLKPGEKPEEWNLRFPEKIVQLHRRYLTAGADIIKTNTFGVNRFKCDAIEETARAAIACAKQAVRECGHGWIAYDIGPTGKLLEPLGPLSFEEAVSAFGETARLAQKYGADLILIETMNDAYETKAALLGVKENSSLPVFVTNVFDESGKLMTGADPRAMIALLEGMGADAIGMNCSLGPDQMLSVAEEYVKYASLPIIVNPNAGLPSAENGKTVYSVDASHFASVMEALAHMGVSVLGGCCGTTPEYICETVKRTRAIPYLAPQKKHATVVSSYTHAVPFGASPILIGERINPTGKKKIREALLTSNDSVILAEGIDQAEAGAQILDVNAGLPEIDEGETLERLIRHLQGVTDLPLQIDTANPEALGRAMRIYNGKPLINSVTGTAASMNAVFPLAKKYGGVIIALTMDEHGIPETADGRFKIAERIVEEAERCGIERCDLIIDPLAMTISSNTSHAAVTLEAIRRIRRELHVHTSLGVSNISFGLPDRDAVNASFFVMAMQAGLSAAIMNPHSRDMMRAYHAFRALTGQDNNCTDYLAFSAAAPLSPNTSAKDMPSETLHHAIVHGMCDAARARARSLLAQEEPLSIIHTQIVPALEEIGSAFEQKKAYLPQLLMSAEAASSAFEILRERLPSSADEEKRIVLATVHGDIHDIGKNIVRVLLENFGFSVCDLGRDVPPDVIAAAAVGCRMVGLSALMTTTLPAMKDTVRQIRACSPDTFIVVGGAVLTQEYADRIGADAYSADAMDTVRLAQKVFAES